MLKHQTMQSKKPSGAPAVSDDDMFKLIVIVMGLTTFGIAVALAVASFAALVVFH
jgi:hypothetical protein